MKNDITLDTNKSKYINAKSIIATAGNRAAVVLKSIRGQMKDDQTHSPAIDIASRHESTLDQAAYDAFVKTNDFKRRRSHKIMKNFLVVPYIFEKDKKQKRRFLFYALKVGDYDAIHLYLPVWSFFKTKPFSYDSETKANPANAGRFKIFLIKGDDQEEVRARWKFEGHRIEIETSKFKAIFVYDPISEKGSVLFTFTNAGNGSTDQDSRTPKSARTDNKSTQEGGHTDGAFNIQRVEDICAALVKARTRAYLSQEAVAQLMDVDRSAIVRLENGRTRPTLKTLVKYANALGATLQIDFLVD